MNTQSAWPWLVVIMLSIVGILFSCRALLQLRDAAANAPCLDGVPEDGRCPRGNKQALVIEQGVAVCRCKP